MEGGCRGTHDYCCGFWGVGLTGLMGSYRVWALAGLFHWAEGEARHTSQSNPTNHSHHSKPTTITVC